MAIRRDAIARNIEARKASVPTIAKGNPLDGRGSEGDITFRRTSGGLKLYIKANHKWHGVKVGESFDSLEKKINEIKSKVDTIKQFRLPSTYSVTGNFTLDASGDIELNADGGQVSIKDSTAGHFLFDCDNTRLSIYDDTSANDWFFIEVGANGATEIAPYDAVGTVGHLTLNIDGNIELNADGGEVTIKDNTASHFLFDCDNTMFRMYDDTDAADFFSIAIGASGATTISTTDDGAAIGHLTLDPDGGIVMTPEGSQGQGVKIDFDTAFTSSANASCLFIDTDQTGIIASGKTLSIRNIDSRLTTNAPTMVGTVEAYGVASSVECGTSGSQTAYGLWTSVSGADTNIGLYIQATDGAGADIKMASSANANDYCYMLTGAEGATMIGTIDADTTAGHLTLRPDGDLVLDPVSQKTIINATDGLYFDSGIHTYIVENADDALRIIVGGDTVLQFQENGDDGNQANFGPTSVGFTQLEPTYDADDTIVEFRASNKQNLTFGAGSIVDVILRFPAMSGNFVLLVKQDGTGSRTVTNWKVAEFDESAADGSAAVVWAGGSNPTLTTDANHVDILSFYWDADNEIAYGVATLDFQF